MPAPVTGSQGSKESQPPGIGHSGMPTREQNVLRFRGSETRGGQGRAILLRAGWEDSVLNSSQFDTGSTGLPTSSEHKG